MAVTAPWVTTAFEFEGYRIAANRGVVRGITVRSRSVIGTFGATLQVGANAMIGMRYDANEIAAGVTEVLAYGTAVVVEPVSR
jgi:uncharacterized protein YbjQ (UPF0145 family)